MTCTPNRSTSSIEFACFWVRLTLRATPMIFQTMEPASTKDIRVMIADPDAALCVSAQRALEQFGYSVTIGHDGTEPLACFAPESIGSVIARVMLRRPQGLDILRRVKKRRPAMPVLLLCDRRSTEIAQAGIHEGAFAYFSTSLEDLAGRRQRTCLGSRRCAGVVTARPKRSRLSAN